AHGLTEVSNHVYCYFDPNSGELLRSSMKNINGNTYYFEQDGAMVTNKFVWLPVEPNNQYGMTYFDNNGQMYKNGKYNIGGHWYLFDQYGAYLTGLQKVNGQTCYFDPQTGWMAQNKFVWLPVEPNNQYGMTYFDNNGQMYKNGKYQIGNHWYYFDQYGAYLTGWQTINGHRYYFDPQTGWMATGKVQIAGKWYTFNNNGVLV
ncbi:MAG: hypothetical protein H9901_00140, partial [Candidatus Paralactobacillus gallistercoris]|nr:hypothetical protein [Candidatus Paralactobacillus gallistercoris]